MWGFAKAILILARQFRRLGDEVAALRELYELDCNSRGIYRMPKTAIHDDTEISYDVKQGTAADEWG